MLKLKIKTQRLKGSTFTDILPQFGKTLLYAIIMNELAVWSYKKQIKNLY